MTRFTGIFLTSLTVAMALGLTSLGLADRQDLMTDSQVIGYRRAGGNDAIARMQQRINAGEVKLEFSESNGYLESVLKQLRVPVSSQGLVFSKTSFQLHRITPHNPRAIYFNDDVYVGWVRAGTAQSKSNGRGLAA